MYYLVYLSSASLLYTEDDLRNILTVSRKNNAQADITGMLLYHDGSIIQVLEGEKRKVVNLYNRIQLDTRHSGVIKLIDGENANRHFQNWSMGFKSLSYEDWKNISGFIEIKEYNGLVDHLEKRNKELFTLIKSFIHVNIKFH